MDVIAGTPRIDPVELRRINLLKDGQTTATGQVIRDGTDRLAGWSGRSSCQLRKSSASMPRSTPRTRTLRRARARTFYHGAGFTGGGEVGSSRGARGGPPDGGVEVLSANIEMGQGTLTVFTELAAARLGLAPET